MAYRILSAEETLITTEDAARILGIPKSSFYSRRCTGDIPLVPIRYGHRTHRYIEAEVWAYRAKIEAKRHKRA